MRVYAAGASATGYDLSLSALPTLPMVAIESDDTAPLEETDDVDTQEFTFTVTRTGAPSRATAACSGASRRRRRA